MNGSGKNVYRLLIYLLALALATSCAASRDSALKQDANELSKGTEKGDFTKLMEKAEGHWEKRLKRDQLESAIATWEKAVKTESPNLSDAQRQEAVAETYETLARAYYFLADAHIRLSGDDVDEEMMKTYEKGVTASEKALALRDPNFAKKVGADESAWQAAVKDADPAAIPALYWYSTNLGKWALLEGIATILARKDDIKVTMDWIKKKDPNFFYGAPYRYFGVYHTKVPIGGGDPPKSKKAFEKSLEIAPNYLATRVLMAQSYAVLVGDRALFEKLLKEVVSAPADVIPEIEPENTMEQRKAKRLLENADDYFY